MAQPLLFDHNHHRHHMVEVLHLFDPNRQHHRQMVTVPLPLFGHRPQEQVAVMEEQRRLIMPRAKAIAHLMHPNGNNTPNVPLPRQLCLTVPLAFHVKSA
jgi:hypothetical protein